MRCYAVIDTNRCKKRVDTLSDRRTGLLGMSYKAHI